MKKIVVNTAYGTCRLSTQAVYLLSKMGFPLEATSIDDTYIASTSFTEDAPDGFRSSSDFPGMLFKDDVLYWCGWSTNSQAAALRSHPALVKVVELLGPAAAATGRLGIEEIPDEALYRIREYDGAEGIEIYSPELFTEGHQYQALPDPVEALQAWAALPTKPAE